MIRLALLAPDGVAIEFWDAEGIEERLHPDLVALLVPAPPEVGLGWRLVGGAWEAPAIPAPAEP